MLTATKGVTVAFVLFTVALAGCARLRANQAHESELEKGFPPVQASTYPDEDIAGDLTLGAGVRRSSAPAAKVQLNSSATATREGASMP